jgi:hypothetical protein
MEISDVTMGKICQSDGLNIGVEGAAHVNVTYTDKVGKVFFVCFSPGFGWTFGVGGIGGVSGVAVVCAVIVGDGCGCGSSVSRYVI